MIILGNYSTNNNKNNNDNKCKLEPTKLAIAASLLLVASDIFRLLEAVAIDQVAEEENNKRNGMEQDLDELEDLLLRMRRRIGD